MSDIKHAIDDSVDDYVYMYIKRRPAQALERYIRNYGLGSMNITADMIRHHWDIERQCTRSILASDRCNRAAVVAKCYEQLYVACPWLLRRDDKIQSDPVRFMHFTHLLRDRKVVFEIGSGEGRLLRFLKTQGYDCIGSDVTSVRMDYQGGDCSEAPQKVADGTIIADSEEYEKYDAVISCQVIEHFHPDSLQDHLFTVGKLLKYGGIYIFDTPHRFAGPADLSRVFELDRAYGLHLREYTYSDLVGPLRSAGFYNIKAIYVPPQRLRRITSLCFASHSYLSVLILCEKILRTIPQRRRKRLLSALVKCAVWRPDIFIIATRS